ncbi:DUF2806 domain-containing protein [Nitrospinota bacterium]
MIDININIPGEKLLMKIWDTIFGSSHIRREGRARSEVRREEMLMLTQAESDVRDIRSGRKHLDQNRNLVLSTQGENQLALPEVGTEGETSTSPPPPTDTPPFFKSAEREIFLREISRQINLRKIAILAEEEGESIPDEEVSDDPIDSDWFTRWRENAQDVSGLDLQRLWAQILAGELKQPGSYSLHTVEFMRRLSKDDA